MCLSIQMQLLASTAQTMWDNLSFVFWYDFLNSPVCTHVYLLSAAEKFVDRSAATAAIAEESLETAVCVEMYWYVLRIDVD